MASRLGRWRWWIALIVVVFAAGAGGFLRAWSGRAPDPLAAGRDAYDRGDWEAAEARARAVLATQRDDRDALRLLARASARQGRDDTAKRLFHRLGAETMQPEDNFLIATALIREGRKADARDALQIVLQDQRDHAEARHELARLSLDDGRAADAAVLIEPLTKDPVWAARADVILGLARDRAHDPSGAVAPLERALARDPELKGADHSPAEVRKLLARALLKTHRPEEAKLYLRAVLDAGADPEASWLMSRAALQADDLPAADAALAQSGPYGAEHPDAFEPAPYVGSARCVACHKGVHHAQQSSRHATTFGRAEDGSELALPATPIPDPDNPGVTHSLSRRDGRIEVKTRVGDQTYQDVVAFILGSGDRGVSLVGREEDGKYRENRLSYYGRGQTWDVTSGHSPRPDDPHEYLGKPLSADGLHSCLNCHTTNFRAILDRTGPEARDRAIGCERCHGPAGNHLAAVGSSFSDPAIGRPRLGSSQAVNQLCGQCHGVGDRKPPSSDPAFLLRFQATTLPASECYVKSGGNLSCVTCHNPHRDAEKSPAFYESKCLSCHGPKPRTTATGASRGTASHSAPSLPQDARRVACPVDPARGCISCHMPVAKGMMAHSTFTDHNIRVHRDLAAPAPAAGGRVGEGRPKSQGFP